MKNFDAFIGIDWSGAKAPIYTKAIAVAMMARGEETSRLVEAPEKLWSRSDVGLWIQDLAFEGKRVLIGIDANFGYAQEIGVQQFGERYTGFDLWTAVDVASANDANYMAQGYWSHAEHKKWFWTEGKQPAHLALPKRLTEVACGTAGYGWPESPFKLLGPKQVGKGGMAAMRMALDLKRNCVDEVAIWPFERELAAEHARVVITEIYPRQFIRRAGAGTAKIKTADDLNACLAHFGCGDFNEGKFSDHQADAIISAAGLAWLCGDGEKVPYDIANPQAMTNDAAMREGWIFGV